MLLRRLYLLAAALVLACASTQAHAYAKAAPAHPALAAFAPPCAAPLQLKSALRACASLSEAAPGSNVCATPSRTKEICPPLRECTSTLGVTGYRKDEATGLYYAQARWYDPLVGGFNGMDPWVGNSGHPITFNKYLYSRSNPLSYIDPDGKVSFLSSAQEYLRGTVQSYETQLGQAIAEDAGGRAFGLGVGKSLASVGEMVISGLNTTSNLIAQHHYDGDVYDQTQSELRANEAGAGEIIAGGHVLGQKVYDDPIGTAQQVGTSAVDFAERLAAADARALGTAGEITGGLLIPAGGAGKKALDQGLDAARIAGRLDLDVSDVVRDLDEGFRPANAAHGVRAAEKPSGGVGVVANTTQTAIPQRVKRGPKTDPGAPHNKKIQELGDAIEAEGGTILAGGGRLPERVIRTPDGYKSSRRPDILYKTPEGAIKGRNVGKTKADGSPVTREQQALEDLKAVGIDIDFAAYDR